MKPTNTPSKHIPLKRLQQIQKDNCLAESGKEYTESEVQERINELAQTKAAALEYEFPPIESIIPPPPLKRAVRGVKPNPVIYNRPTSRHAKLINTDQLKGHGKVGLFNLFKAILDVSNVEDNEETVQGQAQFKISGAV